MNKSKHSFSPERRINAKRCINIWQNSSVLRQFNQCFVWRVLDHLQHVGIGISALPIICPRQRELPECHIDQRVFFIPKTVGDAFH